MGTQGEPSCAAPIPRAARNPKITAGADPV